MSEKTEEEDLSLLDLVFNDGKERLFLATALEDSIKQTHILSKCKDSIYDSTKLIDYEEIQNKVLGIEDTGNIESLLNSKKYSYAKMNNDRDNILESLISIYLDILNNGCFKSMLTLLNDISTKKYRNLVQEINLDENQRKAKSMEREIRNEIIIHKDMIKNCDLQIFKLLDETEDEVWNCSIKKDYIIDWLASKLEQFTLRVQIVEEESRSKLAAAKREIEDEIVVNNEILKFIDCTTEELKLKLISWTTKYNAEYEQFNDEIEKMTEIRKEQLQKIESLQLTLLEHKKEMDEWCHLVNERKKAEELAMLREKSATKIQAWWRGLCVRRRLAAKQVKDKKKKKK